MNQIMLIKPYFFEDMETWAFDDWDVELMHEPFVEGIPAMIDDQNLTGVGIKILLMGWKVGFVLRCLGILRLRLTKFTSRLKN